MSEQHPQPEVPFSPASRGQFLMQKGIAKGAVAPKSLESDPQATEAPYEGKIVQIEGESYRYTQATTHVYNRATGQHEPKPLTLRTWFSHSTPTEGIGMGPGWDSRRRLENLSAAEQIERYGHAFSSEEIVNPQLMPDLPYFELEPIIKEA